MAYKIIANNIDGNYGINKYLCDTFADLADIPNWAEPGCLAYVASNNKTYMKNNAGEWKAINISTGEGSGGGTGGDCCNDGCFNEENFQPADVQSIIGGK